ncbi:MAG: CehA/McbA family metallohydrolase [Myxococcaceae bacterium]|nr:CehA/McbA family metallohydrolase [Myxococcaceae bacterium]
MKIVLSVVLVAAVAVSAAGCAKEGCLGGDAKCVVPPPCPKVSFTCDEAAGAMAIEVIERGDQRPKGQNALGAVNDVVLRNSKATVVIAGLGNQNYLDPNGGSILDLTAGPGTNDAINDILQVVGVLPGDSAHYTSLELIDERPNRVAVLVKGTLDGHPDLPIATRYELAKCDPGVRVRSEIVNRSPDTQMWTLADGFYWSKREPIPFAPGPGSGYVHPSFGLSTINGVFRLFPFLAASNQGGADPAALSSASCTGPSMEGFHSDVVSSAGTKRTVVPPRGSLVFERFISVTTGSTIEPAVAAALEVRRQVVGDAVATLKGIVKRPGARSGAAEREAAVLISEGTLAMAPEKRIPWNQTAPASDGSFTLHVPTGKTYVLEVHAFGRKLIEQEVQVSGDADVGTLTLPSTGAVTFEVRDQDTDAPLEAEVFVVAADDATKDAVTGTFFGQQGTCSPWLGPPPGASPACNRLLIHQGTGTTEVPLGKFHFYAFHGPFWTLARETAEITPTSRTISLKLKALPLQPSDAVSADLHVHGAASFDSSIPDFDRVLSFAASDVEVLVATDHDVIHDYGQVVQDLGYANRMTTITGVETTGHIPWMRIPNYGFPLVIGHYNFWPLQYDATKPRNGAPFDELIEPGELFDRATAARDPVVREPLIELNHPWADSEFGRDLGYPRALALDLNKGLPASDDGTSAGMFVRSPKGGHANNSHDAQEVMNGSQNDLLLPYRTYWFWSLNVGLLKTGTANSDSHSLVDSTIGMPRNLVFAGTKAGPGFDVNRFNDAIRAGKVIGTNGPIIEATVEGATGLKSPSMEPFKPKDGAALHVKVSAAPWVAVQEIRIIVNGQVVKTIGMLPQPADPFGSSELVRYDGTLPLAPLLDGVSGDAWLVVEAGRPLLLAGDLGGVIDDTPDGVPDTTDNNGDGKVDQADVEGAGEKSGPIKNPPSPVETDPNFHFAKITDDGYPFAFTNPFIFDRDGNARYDAPGPKGGR